MYHLNNIDIIILIVLAVSALIGLLRGLIKEVLSIAGWVLSIVAIIYFLPILNPITSKYIMSGVTAGIITAVFILITFLVIWILMTSQLVGKIRTSKLGGLDRMLGLFFGIARAFLLVILANILISWIIPRDKQSKALAESRYFQTAGSFAEPLEKLIPEETLESIRKKTNEFATTEEKTEEEGDKKPKSEADLLFEKLAQPKIKSKKEELKKKLEKEEPIKENLKDDGYDHKERNDLNRLIDSVD